MTILDTSILSSDEEYRISIGKKRHNKICYFSCLGAPGMTKHGFEGLPMPEIFQKLSHNATSFFWLLVENRHPATNKVTIFSKSLTAYQQKSNSKAYKELHKFNLVRKVRKQEYILNPEAYLPKFEFFEDVKKEYDALP